MARNVWQYALMGGVAGAADGYGRALSQQQQLEAQREMRREAAAENERILRMRLDGRQDDIALQAELRGAGSRSSTGSRAGGAVPLTREAVDAGVQAVSGRSADELAAYERGDDLTRRIKQFNDDGSSSVLREERPENFGSLVEQRRAELQRLRKMVAFGKDYKDVAEGELTERAGGGDVDAQAGLLAAKGKGRMESLGGGGGVFDSLDVGGSQRLNPMGAAEANKDNATAFESTAKGKAANERRDPETIRLLTDLTSRERTLRTQMGNLLKDPMIASAIKRGSPPAEYTSMQEELQQITSQREQLMEGKVPKRDGGAPKPAATPAASSTPPASMLKEGVRTKFKNGEVWTLQGGKPVKVG